MSDRDFIIPPTFTVPSGAAISPKPSYLVKLIPEGKKPSKLFLAIEQPKLESSFIQVKGFFYEGNEEVVYKTYNEIIASVDKASYTEMWFPWHAISNIRSLVFRGDKLKK